MNMNQVHTFNGLHAELITSGQFFIFMTYKRIKLTIPYTLDLMYEPNREALRNLAAKNKLVIGFGENIVTLAYDLN